MVLTQPRWIGTWKMPKLNSFHTTMVLTQREGESRAGCSWFSSFHTTMVLTQQSARHSIENWQHPVSIPLWFLRNHQWWISQSWDQLPFPYHYGSYATENTKTEHSTGIHVSIPLWFLRNKQCWSRSEGRYTAVSIPLWFLRNLLQGTRLSALFYVSIPLWFLRNAGFSRTRGRPELSVSIPLWFLRNRVVNMLVVIRTSFHTTMVLTQPLKRWKCIGNWKVSIPLWFLRNYVAANLKPHIEIPFPYHYGSYATRE